MTTYLVKPHYEDALTFEAKDNMSYAVVVYRGLTRVAYAYDSFESARRGQRYHLNKLDGLGVAASARVIEMEPAE